MVRKSKGRSRPMPGAAVTIKASAVKLEKALQVEDSFPVYDVERNPWEVTVAARDGAVHVLRFLKVWFDLPQGVFFSAASYLDQLLTKMKVQAKYLSCLTVSCLSVAAANHGCSVNAKQLVEISQSKCTVKDMQRMSTIVTQKVNKQHCTALDLLAIYWDIFRSIAVQFNTEGLLDQMLQFDKLSARLEILLLNSYCAQIKPSVLALTFIQYQMERFLSVEVPNKSSYYSSEMFYLLAIMIELRWLCKITKSEYRRCLKNVKNTLVEYEKESKTMNCQKLEWRYSASTHQISKATNRFQPSLTPLNE